MFRQRIKVKWSRRVDGFASATTQLPASLDGPDSEINLRASVCCERTCVCGAAFA